MTAATADLQIQSKGAGLKEFPIADNVVIYKGTLVALNSSGYAVPAADTAAYVVVGVSYEKMDNTTTGHSAGRYQIRVQSGRHFRLAGTGFAQSSVGLAVYVTDDNNVQLGVGTNAIFVGVVSEYESSTVVWVYIPFAPGGGGTSTNSGVFDAITGGDAALSITGRAGATTTAGGTVPIVGGAGGTSGGGGDVSLTGGAGGSTSGVAGTAIITGGAGAGTNIAGGVAGAVGGAGIGSAAGGVAKLIGGVGGATGAGGAVTITGGVGGATSGTGGAVGITAGAAGATTGAGGAVTITGGAASGTAQNGGDVNLVGGVATTTGTPGEVKINGSAGGFTVVPFNYIATLATQTIFTAARAYRVKDITGRVRVAGSGGACTLAFFKAPSGTAVGSGTALHTGSFNVAGSADTNQQLVLSATLTDLALAAGDSIGYVLTGTATSAVGNVTISLCPI